MEEDGIGAIVVFRNSNWLYRMLAGRLGREGTELDCFGVLLLLFLWAGRIGRYAFCVRA